MLLSTQSQSLGVDKANIFSDFRSCDSMVNVLIHSRPLSKVFNIDKPPPRKIQHIKTIIRMETQ